MFLIEVNHNQPFLELCLAPVLFIFLAAARDFFSLLGSVQIGEEPIHPSSKWITWLTTQFHLLLRLRMYETKPPLCYTIIWRSA